MLSSVAMRRGREEGIKKGRRRRRRREEERGRKKEGSPNNGSMGIKGNHRGK